MKTSSPCTLAIEAPRFYGDRSATSNTSAGGCAAPSHRQRQRVHPLVGEMDGAEQMARRAVRAFDLPEHRAGIGRAIGGSGDPLPFGGAGATEIRDEIAAHASGRLSRGLCRGDAAGAWAAAGMGVRPPKSARPAKALVINRRHQGSRARRVVAAGSLARPCLLQGFGSHRRLYPVAAAARGCAAS